MEGQPRQHFDEDELMSLMNSIAAIGQQVPAIVTANGDGTYQLRSGERRWRACSRLGIPLWVVVEKRLDAEREFELSCAENFNRADHNIVEKALACKRLKHGHLKRSNKEVAAIFGCHEITVVNYLMLLNKLDPKVLDMMDPSKKHERLLQANAALALTAFHEHPEVQILLARQIVSRRLGINEARHLIDCHAKKLSLTKGRGREKTGHDYLESLKSAIKRLGIRTEEILSMKEEEFKDIFRCTSASEHASIVLSLETRDREIRQLIEALQNLKPESKSSVLIFPT
jgi:ParB family chromosome partitioning protein